MARFMGDSGRIWKSQSASDMVCVHDSCMYGSLLPVRYSMLMAPQRLTALPTTLACAIQLCLCNCMATLSPKQEGTPSCMHSDLGLGRRLQDRAGLNKSISQKVNGSLRTFPCYLVPGRNGCVSGLHRGQRGWRWGCLVVASVS